MKIKIKMLLKNLMVLTVFLVVFEFVLMLMGYEKGFYERNPDFKPVNELVALKGYYADSDGIMKVNRQAAAYASLVVNRKGTSNLFSKLKETICLYINDCDMPPYKVGSDFIDVEQHTCTNDFSTSVSKIENKAVTGYDSLLADYLHHPINSEGFRSISFKPVKTDKTKVLLLGDSFTWGATTENITNSFADILLSKGYVVYNTGIVGADLPQYFAIAKKYMASLKPDVVIVNVYMGNDITKYDREVKPGTPIFYSTNAGNLYSCPQGKYFESAQAVYDYIVSISSIPLTTTFNKIMAQSRITTQLWLIMANKGLITNRYNYKNQKFFEEAAKREIGYSISVHYLKLIKEICDTNNSKLVVSIIPDRKNLSDNPYNYLKGIDYVKLSTIDDSYYSKDGHLNDMGHARYAEFLHQLLPGINK